MKQTMRMAILFLLVCGMAPGVALGIETAVITDLVDGHVSTGSGTNQGEFTGTQLIDLQIRSYKTYRTLIKFDLSSLEGFETDVAVQSATLKLYVPQYRDSNYNPGCSNVNGMETGVYQVTQTWDDSATWTSADGSNYWPDNGTGYPNVGYATETTPLDTVTLADHYYGWVEFDVTPYIQQALANGTTDCGLYIATGYRVVTNLGGMPSTENVNGIYYNSSEAAENGPQLDVDYELLEGGHRVLTNGVDGHVSTGSGTNQGDFTSTQMIDLQIRSWKAYRPLIKFDYSTFDGFDMGVVVKSATLRLYVPQYRDSYYNPGCSNANGMETGVYVLDQAWTDVATWTSADGSNDWPDAGFGYPNVGYATEVVPLDTVTLADRYYGWVEFDVTPYVQQAVANGAMDCGLYVATGSRVVTDLGSMPSTENVNGVYYNSFEATANGPQLEVSYELTTRGHRSLLQHGLQLRACAFPLNVLDGLRRDLWLDSGFTTIDLLYRPYEEVTSDSTSVGLPKAPNEWAFANWIHNSTDDLGTSEYLDSMVSVQYLDEQSIAASELPTLTSEISALKTRFPHAIVYTNQHPLYHGYPESIPLTLELLNSYTQTVKPDMLNFTEYPFRYPGIEGGSPTNMYSHMELYREAGLAGLTGDGSEPIPVGMYVQTFYKTTDQVPHQPSESQFRLQQFAGWAFGMKSIDAFVYTTGDGMNGLFFDGVTQTTTTQYDQYAELNSQSANLGPALVRLISTDLRMIMGRHGSGTVNTVPNLVTTGLSGADDYLIAAEATNLGTLNNGLPGDVVIGFMKPLMESFDGDEYSDQVYFMVVNGLSDEYGSATNARQRIRLNFDMGSSGITSLQRISRTTGMIEAVSLVSDGGSLYHLDLTLDGGTGDLFKYNTGAPIVGVTETAPMPGDANGDGMVDVGDLGILAANYGTASGATWAQGDFNGDGAVDVGDLGILAANYGTGSSSANWSADYTSVFAAEAADEEETADSVCSVLGLPLVAGFVLMGLMLVKLDE